MKIKAYVQNSAGQHHVTLSTNSKIHTLIIPPKSTGFGSSANGGELLFLALATCYCNDIYREASKRGIEVEQVEVEVEGDFGLDGEPAQNVTYRTKILAPVSEKVSKANLRALAMDTDRLTEIQNTLRVETPVVLNDIEIFTR